MKEKRIISELFDFVNKFDENGLTEIPAFHKDRINLKLKSFIPMISKRIMDLRKIRKIGETKGST